MAARKKPLVLFGFSYFYADFIQVHGSDSTAIGLTPFMLQVSYHIFILLREREAKKDDINTLVLNWTHSWLKKKQKYKILVCVVRVHMGLH